LKDTEKDPRELVITPKTGEDSRPDETPVYITRLKLSDTEKKRIVTEVFDELEEIKKEREKEKLEENWDALDNQYDGKMRENEDQMFNLHRHSTKIKVDTTVRLIKSAYMESEPMFAVTPRPEFDRNDGDKICELQQDFLDYKMDMIVPIEDPLDMTFQSSVLKGTGILKLYPHTIRKKNVREEVYKGTPVPVIDQKTKRPILNPQTNQPMIQNEGLESFLRAYPEAIENPRYHGYIKKLSEGQEIKIMVEYKETIYNDPMPKNVNLKDFYCRISTEGYDGLAKTLLTVERVNYTWRELKQEEEKGNFEDIDELAYEKPASDDPERKKRSKYQNETYNILECVYYTKIKGVEGIDDSEEVKCVFWISEDRKCFIGGIVYPLYSVDCYYIPFYIKKKKAGFYQPGMAEDLTDSNIAQNAMLNFALEAAYISNTITPITKDSTIFSQFAEKRWTHGVPIKGDPGTIRFVNEFIRPGGSAELLNIVQYLIQGDDDVTGISQLMTGKESPIDPTAPAAKTLALMEKSGINVRDYIKKILPSFNMIAQIMLQIYHQISQEGIRFSVRPEKVVGDNPFKTITRSDLVAKTNIQSQALAFAIDKNKEKAEDLALYQTLRQEPLIARNPDAVYLILKNIVKGWSYKWKNRIDKILPPFEEFKKGMEGMAVKAVAQYVQAVLQNSKVTGLEPQFDPRELLVTVQDFVAEQVNPLDPEIAKKRAEQMRKQGAAANV